MKFFSLFLLDLILVSIVKFVSLAPLHSEICAETDNYQMIREVVHWKNVLFILFENGNAYKLEDFKWDGTGLNLDFSKSVKFNETLNFSLIFPVLYSGNGTDEHRVVFAHWSDGNENGLPPGYVGETRIPDDSWTSMGPTEPLELDLYKCRSAPHIDPLRLCTLLAKFPTDEMETSLSSISSFPLSGSLPQRLFVYYRETPPKSMNTCPNCFNSKRYLYFYDKMNSANVSEWMLEETNEDMKCTDLNNVIVNASSALTDYSTNGTEYQFDWIEFFGYEYRVLRFYANQYNVSEVQELKFGTISSMLNCNDPPITTPPTEPPSTLPEKPSASTQRPVGNQTSNDESQTGGDPNDENFPPKDQTSTNTPFQTTTASSKSKLTVLLIILFVSIAVVLLFVLIICFCVRRSSGDPPANSVESATPPPPPPPPAKDLTHNDASTSEVKKVKSEENIPTNGNPNSKEDDSEAKQGTPPPPSSGTDETKSSTPPTPPSSGSDETKSSTPPKANSEPTQPSTPPMGPNSSGIRSTISLEDVSRPPSPPPSSP